MSSALKKSNDNRKTVETKNPATGEIIHRWTCHSQDEAELLIDRAHGAFLSWREQPMQDRVAIIEKIADLLEASKQELAEMMTRQMGKPIAQSKMEVDKCVEICRYVAESGPNQLQDEERVLESGVGTIIYQPLGVILAMQPWNFPLYQMIRYCIPNMLAGNTTVLKHAEIVWGTAKKLAEIFQQAGLPEGVFNVALVDNETADALIAHPSVRGVTLTGSAEAGKIVAEIAGKNLKKSVLELGGSDPYIILEDADLDLAVKTCVQGRISNGGQTCVAAKRFIIVESLYEAFREKFVAAMKAVAWGDPMDEDNLMGSLAREDLRNKLHEQVKETITKGANCITGGEIPKGKGYYYPPTVLENIPEDSPAYKEELFGPVAALFKAKDEADAIRIANDHRYGLGGGVFTENKERAEKVARQMETGMVNMNCYLLSQPKLPFGGIKDSGWGRELGGFGIREFVNIKVLMRKG